MSERHGFSGHPLHGVWTGLKERCLNKNNRDFHYYGGRGITVCEEWENNSKSFIFWALENGWKRGLTIDRIDNDKGYSPENCRFVTRAENNRNQRPHKASHRSYKKASNLPYGVCHHGNGFQAQIWTGKKNVYLGTYASPAEASEIFQLELTKR